MTNADGQEVTITRRIYAVGDVYRHKESGKLWELEFILPDGIDFPESPENHAKAVRIEGTAYILGSAGLHWKPLSSEELHELFEYEEPPEGWAPPTVLHL